VRVLVGPRVDLRPGGVAAVLAERLAGPEGTVVFLREAGVSNLSRRLSAAEVHLLRGAMLGGDPEKYAKAGWGQGAGRDGVVGYICQGTGMGSEDATVGAVRLVVATDHADLTWRSPLVGPNDDRLGPRFPSMTGVYAPEVVSSRARPGEGMMVVSGVVAGVLDDAAATGFEAEVAGAQGCAAVSSELVPVVIVAAHLGLRVAAAVVIAGR
jgi:Phosphorylase superfamily